MNRFELSNEEARVLRDVLDTALLELHTEINHTDDRSYRTALKERRSALERVREKLNLDAPEVVPDRRPTA